jgi:spore maturation protein CgeB
MRVLLVHPGARWATADVEAGVCHGLRQHGVDVIRYRLDLALPVSLREVTPDLVSRTTIEAMAEARQAAVDAVIVVTGRFVDPEVVRACRHAGIPVYALFTESPYDVDVELPLAAVVTGGWTTERASVETFQAVNAAIRYLPHGWHPARHFAGPGGDAHDVVFVGSGFPERVTFLNAMNWTGIDLGLYGTWDGFGLKPALEACVRGAQIDNAAAAALYRAAKIGLNLYRRTRSHPAESLNPRAYELARCGTCQVSQRRSEHGEVFGPWMPEFTSPAEAEALIRALLADPERRAAVAQQQSIAVQSCSWADRAERMLASLPVGAAA